MRWPRILPDLALEFMAGSKSWAARYVRWWLHIGSPRRGGPGSVGGASAGRGSQVRSCFEMYNRSLLSGVPGSEFFMSQSRLLQ